MMLKKFTLTSTRRDEMINITDQVQEFITENNINEGSVLVFSPHTTAGITINAHPDPKRDMLDDFDKVFPRHHNLDLHMDGNTAAHMKSATVGASQQVIVTEGKVLLGKFQGIFFCEFDGPRPRTFYVKIQ
jgi:secondary thiamine-phosphate synthase enzyme